MMNNFDWKRSGIRMLWVALLFSAAAIVISAVQWKETTPSAGLSVKIEPLQDGNNLINTEDILLKINRSFGFELSGMPMNTVDIERLEKILVEDPFILDADAYVDANSRINIKVTQREPILRIIDNNGLNYYLDKDGMKMPTSEHFTARVLVASGNIPPHVPNFLERKKHLLKDVFQLTEMILADDFFRPMIEQIYVSNRGELTLIPKVGDQKIIFGRFADAERKLRHLKVFYEEGVPYEGWQKFKAYNLKYAGQVVGIR